MRKRVAKVDAEKTSRHKLATKTVLPSTEVPKIVKAIREWNGRRRMTWEDVLDLVEDVTRTRFTRQTLNKKPEIKNAYLAKIEVFSKNLARPKRVRKLDAKTVKTAESLRKQIALLDGVIAHHKKIIEEQNERINKYHVMFATWQTVLLESYDIKADMLNIQLSPAQRL